MSTTVSASVAAVLPDEAGGGGGVADIVGLYLTRLYPLSKLDHPLPALVGNKRVYGGWGMLVSYYLPGNSLAAPPSHRVGGATANVEVQQGFLIPSHLSGGWEVQHSF